MEEMRTYAGVWYLNLETIPYSQVLIYVTVYEKTTKTTKAGLSKKRQQQAISPTTFLVSPATISWQKQKM